MRSQLALQLLLPVSIWGFDTGPHNDMTRNVLENFGYSKSAQDVISVANWFTDVYAFAPNFGNKVGVLPNHILPLEEMHCNNLYNIVYGVNYASQHVLNTRNAVRDAASRGDTLAFMALMGTSVHLYQDFYAHSNWAELQLTHDCDCYLVDRTLFSHLKVANGSLDAMLDANPQLNAYTTYQWKGPEDPYFNIFPGTLQHGDYCNGINHDSAVRPNFEEAYAWAYGATTEWIANVERWAREVNPNIVENAKAWQPADDTQRTQLQDNQNHAFEVSYSTTAWIFGEDNGHWKGSGSGDLTTFAASTAKFSSSNTFLTNLYTGSNPVWYLLSEPSPYRFLNDSRDPQSGDVLPDQQTISQATSYFTPLSSLPSNYTDVKAIVLRTTEFNISSSYEGLISRPNPYAVVEFDGWRTREAPMHGQRYLKPWWTSIRFYPSSARGVNIVYTLMDTAASNSQGKQINITSGEGKLRFTLNTEDNTLTGGVTGVHNTTDSIATVTAPDGTSLKFFVDTRQFICSNSMDANELRVSFCKNTAYGELGVFSDCEGSRQVWDHSAAVRAGVRVGMLVLVGLVGLVLIV
ncbi:hypothetical protein HK097_008957 [Rhizophlyctis rosea]|uniref:Uncharacterized protein n=1 Tax=Rhizophlyctis rosea TaxID=64517 RepID=A0AAD5SIM8_9FUNG|nr:hypothetical protein HK097_008957 [Rhizophlyctis rosea]